LSTPLNRKTIDLLLDKSQERQYLRIPFEVGEDAERLDISYEYQRRRPVEEVPGNIHLYEVNIIDLGLEDPAHALIGASGSERCHITVEENWATDGYRAAALTPGVWYVILGVYKVEEAGCPLILTVEQTRKESVLLKGDTHVHTTHSDGRYTVEETIQRAREDRLDYLFITDHNSMTSNEHLVSTPDLTILPGVEITYYDGHYNLYGVKRPVNTFVANSREEVLAIMREGRENGAIASLNHPIDLGCPWKFGFGEDVPADMIEIWNGPFTPWNAATVDLWHKELCRGRHWPAIGGSDAHRGELFRLIATPATFLYARSRQKSDILQAMRAGHAFIGMSPDAPTIHMAVGKALMGDTAACGDGQTLRLALERLSAGDEVRLINEQGIVYKETPGAWQRFEMEKNVQGSRFIRAEVWRALPGIGQTLAAISNPIYFER
jgi:hypothetical protein